MDRAWTEEMRARSEPGQGWEGIYHGPDTGVLGTVNTKEHWFTQVRTQGGGQMMRAAATCRDCQRER